MIKQSIFAIGLLLFAVGCNKKITTISGDFTDANGEMLIFEDLTGAEPKVIDSAKLDAKGHFEFKKTATHLGFYRIRIGMENFGVFIVDSLQGIKITGSAKDIAKTYKVVGSTETDAFLAFQEVTKAGQLAMDTLQGQFQSVVSMLGQDSSKMDSVNAVFQARYITLKDKLADKMEVLIKEKGDAYAVLAFLPILDPAKKADVYESTLNKLNTKFPKNKEVQTFTKQFNDIKQKQAAEAALLPIGTMAPEIDLPTPEGSSFKLSSLKGKIVLVDFWASWCKPCRAENPNVVKLYNKYKAKGFEILSVSLDKQKENWIEAIAKDQLTWQHVSDLAYFNCKAAIDYGVQAIPFTVLIDKEGKILAKGLRGEELEAKIASLIGA